MSYISIPPEVQGILLPFLTLFSSPVCYNAQILAIGAILCTGKRTVTAALKVMGQSRCKTFTNFHRILNRSHINMLLAGKILLGILIMLIPESKPLIIPIDETIERRKGDKINAKGTYRDAVRSSSKKVVNCFGLKWISMMLVVPLPWSKRCWALPFLTVLAPSKASNEKNGKRHKTTVDWARQMIMLVRRWIPARTLVLVGDGAYAAVSLALLCQGMPVPVILVSRLRLDAGLYDFPPPVKKVRRGVKPQKGGKQTSLEDRVGDPSTIWKDIEIPWYDGKPRSLKIISGVSLWHTPGWPPVPIKWVVVRGGESEETKGYFCTDINASEEQILAWFILRWNIEVTFEELRAHLGIETQRQWSDKAIARTTPMLFGMFSIIVLMALDIVKGGAVPIMNCAWYDKREAAFSDVIALVRRHIWEHRYSVNSTEKGDITNFDSEIIKIMIDQLCYGT